MISGTIETYFPVVCAQLALSYHLIEVAGLNLVFIQFVVERSVPTHPPIKLSEMGFPV